LAFIEKTDFEKGFAARWDSEIKPRLARHNFTSGVVSNSIAIVITTVIGRLFAFSTSSKRSNKKQWNERK
jgi:hypothetical protein